MYPTGPGMRLPEPRLGFSKGIVAFSLLLVAGGLALMFCKLSFGPMAGAVCIGLGWVVFFAAGYYWPCGNETCG